MIDFFALGEFSRNNCIAICSALVPANLIASLLTLIFVFFERPRNHLRVSALIAISFAIILALHVASWWVIGVVQPPTFILLALSAVCLGLNGWGMAQKGHWKNFVFKRIGLLKYNFE